MISLIVRYFPGVVFDLYNIFLYVQVYISNQILGYNYFFTNSYCVTDMRDMRFQFIFYKCV